jgi:hypothetical protein
VGSERRQHPRYTVTWPARLWLHETSVLAAHTVDISLGGIRIALYSWIPTGALSQGQAYRIEVRPDTGDRVSCVGEIRHMDSDGIGFEVPDGLPAALIPATPA